MKTNSAGMMTFECSSNFNLADLISIVAISIWLHNPQVIMERIACQIEVIEGDSLKGMKQNNAE